jgi:RecA/RadA recombinase
MAGNKFLSQLHKDAKKIQLISDVPDWYAQTKSPALNYLFGKSFGLKAGYTAMIYGPPKSGKSLLSYAFAGHLHQTDPEAIVLHFDTEFRDNTHWYKAFGIDEERFVSRQTNDPTEIFDYIANDVKAMLQDGAKIKMIIIDSLAAIMYPKEGNKDSTTDHVMGDAGAYLPGAVKKILPIIRQFKIATLLCQHIRANFDPNMAKYKPYTVPGGHGLKHSVEFWLLVEKINNKDSRVFDGDKKDGAGNPIQIGHKLRVKMEESSMSPQNRAVEVDLSYTDGIINTADQVASLAVSMGIVEQAGAWVMHNGKKWQGVANFALALKEDLDLEKTLIDKIKENDIT